MNNCNNAKHNSGGVSIHLKFVLVFTQNYSETAWDKPKPFVITGVCHNRVNLCSKLTFGTKLFVCYNRVFVISEFVITEFHCTSKFTSRAKNDFFFLKNILYIIRLVFLALSSNYEINLKIGNYFNTLIVMNL